MSIRRIAALLAGILLLAAWANGASHSNLMRITVLDSETRALPIGDNGVPQNCDQLTFDAYCRSTQRAPLVSTLLVQEGSDPPFRISCTIQSSSSRCQPLPRGVTFEARREKHGVTLFYVDDNGKGRQEFYKYVDAEKKSSAPVTRAAAAAGQPAAAASQNSGPASAPQPDSAGNAPSYSKPVAPSQNPSASVASSSTSYPSPNAAPPASGAAQGGNTEKVRCRLTSTPAGAEITLDGKYVGNTPSVVSIISGTHEVVVSMPGFAAWKRELTVTPGSELNVSAVLQKQPQ